MVSGLLTDIPSEPKESTLNNVSSDHDKQINLLRANNLKEISLEPSNYHYIPNRDKR